jgi:hypothetical protein
MRKMRVITFLFLALIVTAGCSKINPESKIIGLWKTAAQNERIEFFKDHTAMYYPSGAKQFQNALSPQIEFNWILVDDNRVKLSSMWFGSSMGQIQNDKFSFNGSEFSK